MKPGGLLLLHGYRPEQLRYGNMLHKVLADAIDGKAALSKPFTHLQPWVDKVRGGNAFAVEDVSASANDTLPADFLYDNLFFLPVHQGLQEPHLAAMVNALITSWIGLPAVPELLPA